MLDAQAVTVLSQQCAPGVAPATLLAIVRAESGLDPLAIGVNAVAAPRPRPTTRTEAIAAARALVAAGRDIDLGLAQINVRNLARLGLSLEAAFDPCRNLAAAGVVLRTGYRPAEGADPQAALRVALSRYNTGHPERGFRNGYVARVEQAAARLGLAAPGALRSSRIIGAAARPAPAAPPPAPASWDVFAQARFSAVLAFAPSDTSWRILE